MHHFLLLHSPALYKHSHCLYYTLTASVGSIMASRFSIFVPSVYLVAALSTFKFEIKGEKNHCLYFDYRIIVLSNIEPSYLGHRIIRLSIIRTLPSENERTIDYRTKESNIGLRNQTIGLSIIGTRKKLLLPSSANTLLKYVAYQPLPVCTVCILYKVSRYV